MKFYDKTKNVQNLEIYKMLSKLPTDYLNVIVFFISKLNRLQNFVLLKLYLRIISNIDENM